MANKRIRKKWAKARAVNAIKELRMPLHNACASMRNVTQAFQAFNEAIEAIIFENSTLNEC